MEHSVQKYILKSNQLIATLFIHVISQCYNMHDTSDISESVINIISSYCQPYISWLHSVLIGSVLFLI